MSPGNNDLFHSIYDLFAHGTRLTYAAMGVGVLVAFLYFGAFFSGLSGFKDDAANAGKDPLFNKDYDYVGSAWSKDKIFLWIILSVGSAFLAYNRLPVWLPGVFGK